MSKYSGTVKGLNIATAIISGVYIVLMLLALAGLTLAFNSGTFDYSYSYSYGSSTYFGSGTGIDSDMILAYGYGVIVGLIIFCIVCAIISIIAAILGISRCKQPDKIGVAFGMAIVGAVVTFFSGNIVSMVLHIIACVFSNKVKNDNPAPAQFTNPQGE